MSDYVCDQTFIAAQNRWITACGYRDVPTPSQGWLADLLTNGWVITGLYVLIALALARTAITVIRKRGHEGLEPEEVVMIGGAALFWPLTLLGVICWRIVTGGARKIDRREDERRARAKQLRADARDWDAKQRTGTDAEREMAAQLAKLCREQADDLERTS